MEESGGISNSTNYADDGTLTVDEDTSKSSTATTPIVHSYAYDLMTVLSCPYQLQPMYLVDSQIIMECTKTEQITSSCPGEC
ncbi:hypothetical protein OESDEN_12897 [Oesophagostomum dentatum]|uniref:Uncharacterized protein n=1 Tax=Oesophagostomum dentatum TaxID=61180 RepID=A0A0B1SVV3_OESDE|nr:hypothetical protein OESDEN_12897 [Oesophagostomum dentatum]